MDNDEMLQMSRSELKAYQASHPHKITDAMDSYSDLLLIEKSELKEYQDSHPNKLHDAMADDSFV